MDVRINARTREVKVLDQGLTFATYDTPDQAAQGIYRAREENAAEIARLERELREAREFRNELAEAAAKITELRDRWNL